MSIVGAQRPVAFSSMWSPPPQSLSRCTRWDPCATWNSSPCHYSGHLPPPVRVVKLCHTWSLKDWCPKYLSTYSLAKSWSQPEKQSLGECSMFFQFQWGLTQLHKRVAEKIPTFGIGGYNISVLCQFHLFPKYISWSNNCPNIVQNLCETSEESAFTKSLGKRSIVLRFA